MHERSNEPPKRYASTKEWCRISNMGMTSTYAALARGDLVAIKLGRRTLVDVDAGLAWLRAQPKWAPSTPAAPRRRQNA
jgi:hypothetical protein